MTKPTIFVKYCEETSRIRFVFNNNEFNTINEAFFSHFNDLGFDPLEFVDVQLVDSDSCESRYIRYFEKNIGKVGVIVSPDYGSGWSTEVSSETREPEFDPILCFLIDYDVNRELLLETAEFLYHNNYCSGLTGAELVFVDKGVEFIIDVYDGAESIKFKDNIVFKKA